MNNLLPGRKNLALYLFCTSLAFSLVPVEVRAEPMRFLMQAFPPFVIDEKGLPTGPFPETVAAVCAAMQVACTQEFQPWRRAQYMAENGQIDGLFVILKTPEREGSYYFTAPIVETAYGIFVQKTTPLHYTQAADVQGYTIGVYGPSGTSSTAKSALQSMARGITLIEEIDNLTALRKLNAGRYGVKGAVVINLDLGNWLVRQQHYGNVKAVGEIQQNVYTIGLSRKKLSKEQFEKFDAALQELIRNGTVKSIVEKYGLKPAP